jgi:hypothetical protein
VPRCITRSSQTEICGIWQEVYAIGAHTNFGREFGDLAYMAIVTDVLMLGSDIAHGVVYVCGGVTKIVISPETDTSRLTVIKLTAEELNTLMRARSGFTA